MAAVACRHGRRCQLAAPSPTPPHPPPEACDTHRNDGGEEGVWLASGGVRGEGVLPLGMGCQRAQCGRTTVLCTVQAGKLRRYQQRGPRSYRQARAAEACTQ